MKIAFIHDPFQKLGVQYISSVLKKGGHETRLFIDPQLFDDIRLSFKRMGGLFDYKRIIVEELKAYQPDLICFSVVTDFYQRACVIAKQIKQDLDVPILFGGNHPTLVPDRVMGNDFVDMVCVGEGEYAMLELVNSMEKGKPKVTIENIWFKKNGRIIKNKLRSLIKNIDELPFPDQEIYRQASPHFRVAYFCATSRGCPNACSYCINSFLHSCYKGEDCFYHQRSVQSVIDELVEAKQKYRIKHVMFVDESFGHNSSWLEDFSVEYKRKVALPFHCAMYPSDVSEKSLGCIKEAGCVEINVGIQSWDEKLIRRMGRGVSVENMKYAITLIKASKIRLVTEEIIGLPEQTEESFLRAADIYNIIKPARSFLHPLKYYPNTAMTKQAFKKGIISENDRERVLDGLYGKSYQQGGDFVDRDKFHIIFMFFLARVLPRSLFKIIVRRKLFKVLPVSCILKINSVLDNLFSYSVDTHILRLRFFICYAFFLKKFFCWYLNRKL